MKSITVVIPNYNGMKFLQGCLDSLREQSDRDFETVMIDNGSTDESVAFVRSGYPEVKIRAVVEGQVCNMRERTKWIGDFAKVFVTGGASRSAGIRGVIADVFGCEVKTLEVTDSAAVGGAILAGTFVG